MTNGIDERLTHASVVLKYLLGVSNM